MNSLVPAMERLQAFTALEQNWDSYDGYPPSPTALATASTFIVAVDERRYSRTELHAPPWMIAPGSDGSVQIDWKHDPIKIEVEIARDGELAYLIIDRSGATPEYVEEYDVPSATLLRVVDSILGE